MVPPRARDRSCRPRRRPGRAAVAALLLSATVAAAGCGRSAEPPDPGSTVGAAAQDADAADRIGFPTLATKNTTRIAAADPVAAAAGTAQAVFPGGSDRNRAAAVALVDRDDWRTALAASSLLADPIDAPVLFSDDDALPAATEGALDALAPRGSEAAGGAQVLRVGDVARPEGRRTTDIDGTDPFALAAGIDRFASTARGRRGNRVVVVGSESPAYAMPAAGWAAKSGDPILFATADGVPTATRRALQARDRPEIYVLGPSRAVGPRAIAQLQRLGDVTRVGDGDPVRNAIAFAGFSQGSFGWGIAEPGHGLVIARDDDPLNAAAVAPLSARGSYGPLLLTTSAERIPEPLRDFVLDIQPGFATDPVRGVYNHAWLLGGTGQISQAVQSRLDAMLEISPVSEGGDSDPEPQQSASATAEPETATPPSSTASTSPRPSTTTSGGRPQPPATTPGRTP